MIYRCRGINYKSVHGNILNQRYSYNIKYAEYLSCLFSIGVYIRYMKRVNHHLTEKQIKKLKELSKKTGLSASELIRRALDEYFYKIEGKERNTK